MTVRPPTFLPQFRSSGNRTFTCEGLRRAPKPFAPLGASGGNTNPSRTLIIGTARRTTLVSLLCHPGRFSRAPLFRTVSWYTRAHGVGGTQRWLGGSSPAGCRGRAAGCLIALPGRPADNTQKFTSQAFRQRGRRNSGLTPSSCRTALTTTRPSTSRRRPALRSRIRLHESRPMRTLTVPREATRHVHGPRHERRSRPRERSPSRSHSRRSPSAANIDGERGPENIMDNDPAAARNRDAHLHECDRG